VYRLDNLEGSEKPFKKKIYVFIKRVRRGSRYYDLYKKLAESLSGPVLELDMSGNFPAQPKARLITLWGLKNPPKTRKRKEQKRRMAA
jgi:hypothetical protein